MKEAHGTQTDHPAAHPCGRQCGVPLILARALLCCWVKGTCIFQCLAIPFHTIQHTPYTTHTMQPGSLTVSKNRGGRAAQRNAHTYGTHLHTYGTHTPGTRFADPPGRQLTPPPRDRPTCDDTSPTPVNGGSWARLGTERWVIDDQSLATATAAAVCCCCSLLLLVVG